MVKAKVLKLVLDGYGSYLGMEKGCFIVKDKEGNVERYPLFEQEIGEVVLKSGNMVSTGALASLGFWDIDVLILTQKGRPVAMLKGLDDESHVKTRLCQYEAVNNGKGVYVAKQLVLSKIEGQNVILEKHGLKTHDSRVKYEVERLETQSLDHVRRKLLPIEAKYSKRYFSQIFELFPEKLRPENRETFKAYDGVNNTFNLAYEVLSWKVHRAIVRAKLEPYLGFLHSVQFGKPSLVCDLQELYRCLIDDFLIQHCQKLKKKDFEMKHEDLSKDRKGKREYLNGVQTSELMKKLSIYFESKVEIPRIRVGKRQTLETLINEEALLIAKYLRDERKSWIPRIAIR
jgi:CRISPR-associated protein Cas1